MFRGVKRTGISFTPKKMFCKSYLTKWQAMYSSDYRGPRSFHFVIIIGENRGRQTRRLVQAKEHIHLAIEKEEEERVN